MHIRQIIIEKGKWELDYKNYECGFDYLNEKLLSFITNFIVKEGKVVGLSRIN